MNERIKQLHEQATTWALDNYPPPVNTFMWEDLRNEKFAELIVRECATTAAMFSMENKRIHPDIDPCDMPSANQMVYHSTCQSVAYAIREHFGIEE